jgi:hypothetical protein
MEKVNMFGLIVVFMKIILEMGKWKVKDKKHGKMEISILVNLRMMKLMGMVLIFIEKVINLKE